MSGGVDGLCEVVVDQIDCAPFVYQIGYMLFLKMVGHTGLAAKEPILGW